MAEQGSGSILNMASAAGLIGWPGAHPATSPPSTAWSGLTKSAALEFAAQGIRVNSICPSYVETPMVARPLREHSSATTRRRSRRPRANHPIGRFAQPPEIAAACVWLLSDKASFVTGTAMSVDGGYTAP